MAYPQTSVGWKWALITQSEGLTTVMNRPNQSPELALSKCQFLAVEGAEFRSQWQTKRRSTFHALENQNVFQAGKQISNLRYSWIIEHTEREEGDSTQPIINFVGGCVGVFSCQFDCAHGCSACMSETWSIAMGIC